MTQTKVLDGSTHVCPQPLDVGPALTNDSASILKSNRVSTIFPHRVFALYISVYLIVIGVSVRGCFKLEVEGSLTFRRQISFGMNETITFCHQLSHAF